jgi:hypothetical protein
MIIHKNLINFLELIHNKNLNFQAITECELRSQLKNNEYYNLKLFCLQNDLVIINRHEINLTVFGLEFFKILKKCRKI